MRSSLFHYCTALLVMAAPVLASAFQTPPQAPPPKPAPAPLPAPPDVAAPPKDATTLPSGLAFKVLQPGTGTTKPATSDLVTVHYTGWTTDGKMFDSSYSRNAPSSFPLDRVIKGWGEGVQLMVVGEKTRFWIPQNIAYKGQAGSPAGMLVFDVELIAIRD